MTGEEMFEELGYKKYLDFKHVKKFKKESEEYQKDFFINIYIPSKVFCKHSLSHKREIFCNEDFSFDEAKAIVQIIKELEEEYDY